MAKSKWIVTVSSARPIREVEQALRQGGFEVEHTLEEVGSIVGQAEAASVDALRKIAGVEAIEADLPFDVGPPDAPVS